MIAPSLILQDTRFFYALYVSLLQPILEVLFRYKSINISRYEWTIHCSENSVPLDLHEGVAGGRGHSAHVLLVPGHLDVAAVSPGGAPAVLDEPVGLARLIINSVTDSQDTVVEVLWAALLIPVYAAVVELETLVAGINSDADRALNME